MRRCGVPGDVHCLSGLFPKVEGRVAQLTEALNQARTAAEKAPSAEALREAVEALLNCRDYEAQSADCRICRGFSELRHKTALLIIKVGGVADGSRRSGLENHGIHGRDAR